jgi:threonine synthase
VILPAGKIASGKMVQAFAYGARIVAIQGNFDDALEVVRRLGQREDFTIVNSINPDRIAGQKTAAFEIVDELTDAPDFHLLPVGNAGNITAYWRGYNEYFAAGKSKRRPHMIGFQAAGAAPIYRKEVVVRPETIATAIRIGNPASWLQADRAVAESAGAIDIVSDEEILTAQSWFARKEGIFVEPASAAPIAGLLRACGAKASGLFHTSLIPEGSRIVCTVTGHGLKDPEAISSATDLPEAVAPNEEDVLRALEER